MKNKITDLNNHLFVALERLNEEGLSDERIAAEIERSKAVAQVATQIIGVGSLALKAAELQAGGNVPGKLVLLGGGD